LFAARLCARSGVRAQFDRKSDLRCGGPSFSDCAANTEVFGEVVVVCRLLQMMMAGNEMCAGSRRFEDFQMEDSVFARKAQRLGRCLDTSCLFACVAHCIPHRPGASEDSLATQVAGTKRKKASSKASKSVSSEVKQGWLETVAASRFTLRPTCIIRIARYFGSRESLEAGRTQSGSFLRCLQANSILANVTWPQLD
jgi:hypothetical protein